MNGTHGVNIPGRCGRFATLLKATPWGTVAVVLRRESAKRYETCCPLRPERGAPVSEPSGKGEPAVRYGSPALTGGASVSRPRPPVLFPEQEPEDPGPPVAPKVAWHKPLLRPAAYVASGLAGAGLILALTGLVGSWRGSPGARATADSAPGAAQPGNIAVLDRRADTLALAIASFSLRVGMYDSRRMPCAGLARGLAQVEDAWLAYNVAHKDMLTTFDSSRDARDKSLYADVRAVEVRFERSSCPRP